MVRIPCLRSAVRVGSVRIASNSSLKINRRAMAISTRSEKLHIGTRADDKFFKENEVLKTNNTRLKTNNDKFLKRMKC